MDMVLAMVWMPRNGHVSAVARRIISSAAALTKIRKKTSRSLPS